MAERDCLALEGAGDGSALRAGSYKQEWVGSGKSGLL